MLPTNFGFWQTVYWWFRRFVRRMLFQTIHDVSLMLDFERAGREASPTAGVLNSQTVKAPHGPARGYDAAKKTVGRKRHIVVDTDGRLLMLNLTTADVSDSVDAQLILDGVRKQCALTEAPVCRWRLCPHQAARQGRVPGLHSRDRTPDRYRAGLQGAAPALGGRTHVWLDDALAQAGARRRGAARRCAYDDPRRYGKPATKTAGPPISSSQADSERRRLPNRCCILGARWPGTPRGYRQSYIP